MRMNLVDNQQAMAFLVSQTTYIEAEVYRTQYPDIIYPQLVPIDTSAMEWAKSVTYFSVDKVGKADWLSSASTELPLADIALICGFGDQSYFTRIFSRSVGASPGAWRRARSEG